MVDVNVVGVVEMTVVVCVETTDEMLNVVVVDTEARVVKEDEIRVDVDCTVRAIVVVGAKVGARVVATVVAKVVARVDVNVVANVVANAVASVVVNVVAKVVASVDLKVDVEVEVAVGMTVLGGAVGRASAGTD